MDRQILLVGFEDFFVTELFCGGMLKPDITTLGRVMRGEHSEILGQDNLRFGPEEFETRTRIKLEKKLAEAE